METIIHGQTLMITGLQKEMEKNTKIPNLYVGTTMTHNLKPHVRPGGFYLTCPSGRVWSCVNLGMPHGKNPSPDSLALFENIGKSYDEMGGRFEAMILTDEGVDPDHQIREHSMDALFDAVEKYDLTIDLHDQD